MTCRCHYRQDTPPVYDLGNIRIPTALYHGTNDALADMTDVQVRVAAAMLLLRVVHALPCILQQQILIDLLPDSTVVHTKLVQGFAHMDFTWGKDANTQVYADLIHQLAKYNHVEK